METPPNANEEDQNPFGGFRGAGDPFGEPAAETSNPGSAPIMTLGSGGPDHDGGVNFDDEAFGSVDAHELIDQDEKLFEEENRFNQTAGNGAAAAAGDASDLSGVLASEVKSGGPDETRMSMMSSAPEDPLSRSNYFQMNSSRYL